jgi:hypothetical protein
MNSAPKRGQVWRDKWEEGGAHHLRCEQVADAPQ